MRQLLLCAVMFLLTTVVNAAPVTDQAILDNLQSVSVTISVDGRGRGSGTMFTREVSDGVFKSYVWTAAHVVDDLRTERMVIDRKTGTKRIIVGFKDCQIYQETLQDGRKVAQRYLECRVVCYSNCDTGEDIALLEVRLSNYTTKTTTFYLGDKIPGIGTELIHVGSLLGDIGSNSLTTGVTSQVGRLLSINGNYAEAIYDQTSTVAFPGSSGGGCFNQETGQYIGMLTAGIRDAQGFHWYVPVRRMRDWAKEMNLEWAMDATASMPNAADLKAIPIDDGR